MPKGKDGKEWDRARWMEWACSASRPKLVMSTLIDKEKREKKKNVRPWFCPKCFSPIRGGHAIAKHKQICTGGGIH